MSNEARAPRLDAWVCAALVLAMFLLARPYVEMGLVDDFSYVKTTWVFAHTGKLVYNGWATAMLGWQIPFAAVFVRVLGDTFFACRLAVTVLLVLSVVVIHRVFARAGLTRERAAFGALLVGASPLTMPMAATFMTDVAGMFVIVCCLYCALRVVKAESHAAVLGWLVAGFAIGAVGGTARQIAWMAALVMMPSAAWLVRKRRGVVALSVVMWVASLAVMLGSLRWFAAQPFHVPEPLVQGAVHVRLLRELWGTATAAMLCLTMLALPALSEGVRRLRALTWAAVVGGAAVLTVFLRWVTAHQTERGLAPWSGDIVERMDVFQPQTLWMLGAPPATMGTASRGLLSFAVVAVAVAFCVVMARAERVAETRDVSWWELLVILGPFCCAYCGLLIPRGLWAVILDRYLLPLLVIAVLVLLRVSQERFGKLGALPWVMLLLWTAWTVAGLHDWIAEHRARLEAVAELHRDGVADKNLSAGYEYDGMTQIELAGAVYDPRVKYPAGFAHALPVVCAQLYNEHTPALQPEYFVGFGQQSCVRPVGMVRYRRWLPPFEGTLVINKLDR